ncbi:MAG: glycosyltransferase family 2 protein [Rhodothermales bacterium]
MPDSEVAAWLFWDSRFGIPDIKRIQKALVLPGHLWHAGLRLRMQGKPGIIDFVHPTWMLNRDPDPDIEATSWRLSLRACLIRTEVLRQMGGPRPAFRSLDGAALEMGHRYISRGVFMRHVPWLVPDALPDIEPLAPLVDELRFALYRFGRFWSRWALGRALFSGYAPRRALIKAWRQVSGSSLPGHPPPFQDSKEADGLEGRHAWVSVLIPTLERYSYLRTLLHQLRAQTIPPYEIIVVDQTPFAQRDTTLAKEFPDLPLRVYYQDQPGQCSSRNAGLQQAEGDYILFIDDDDEVSPSLIERHLNALHRFRAGVSCGVADEVGAGPLPDAFRLVRASDVFPTNNTLICKHVLERSGLFDLAYEHGQRADGDLGMRIYLGGVLMVLNPEISVVHHHAPRGGLRAHKARVITYASSRSRLQSRHLPSVTEIYLSRRYFSRRQVREMLWLRVFGTFSVRGGFSKKMLKCFVGLITLPHTLWKIRQHYKYGSMMLEDYPQIPNLNSEEAVIGSNV